MPDELDSDTDFGHLEWKKIGFIFLGLLLFTIVYYSPPWSEAIDPKGKHFVLSLQGKGALAVALLAAIWWVFEVVPIGVTSPTIGVLQVLFFIRPARAAFTDFMDPSVMFIFASIFIGMVFTKTGLTKRLAFRMLLSFVSLRFISPRTRANTNRSWTSVPWIMLATRNIALAVFD